MITVRQAVGDPKNMMGGMGEMGGDLGGGDEGSEVVEAVDQFVCDHIQVVLRENINEQKRNAAQRNATQCNATRRSSTQRNATQQNE